MENQQPKQQTKTKHDKRVLIIIIIALLSLLFYFLLGSYLVDYFLGDKRDITLPEDNKIVLSIDDDVKDGGLTRQSREEIAANLNEKVADGMINISMNTNPVFESGTAKGTLMITNNEVNRYPQQIEIFRTDTDELVYSNGVGVGQCVETGDLAVNLPKGTYDCTAYFHAVNPETGSRIGTAAAVIKITILS